MDKVSHEQLESILGAVPDQLRKLAAERDYWRDRAETYERQGEVAKVASAMREKNLNADMSDEEIYAHLEKAASEGQLGEIARAVDMVAPDMGQKIGSLSDRHRGGGDPFVNTILG